MVESAKRKPLGKRLRFEVFKRDGFKCRYCGVTPDQCVLHVDHVVAIAQGGGDEPENLVTACAGCNLGKSDRKLDATAIPLSADPEVLREHIEQIREHLALQKDLSQAKDDVHAYVCGLWRARIGHLSSEMTGFLRHDLTRESVETIAEAIDIVAVRMGTPNDQHHNHATTVSQQKYFHGVLRKMRKDRAANV